MKITCLNCRNVSENETEAKEHDNTCKKTKYSFGYIIHNRKKLWQIIEKATGKVIVERTKRNNALVIFTRLTGEKNIGY